MAVYPLLALLWALVLIPPMVRGRARNRSELAEFDRMRLCFVGSTVTPSHAPVAVLPTPIRRSATQRRRRVLAVLGASIALTLVAAVLLRTRMAWGMHLMTYNIVIAYVGLLAHARDQKAKRHHLAAVPEARSLPVTRPYSIPRSARMPIPTPTPIPAMLQAASR